MGDADADDLKGVQPRAAAGLHGARRVRWARSATTQCKRYRDRKALLHPETGSGEAYEAPQGEVEQALAKVWVDLLDVERVGRHDNFFALGGDSILSLQLMARAQQSAGRLRHARYLSARRPHN